MIFFQRLYCLFPDDTYDQRKQGNVNCAALFNHLYVYLEMSVAQDVQMNQPHQGMQCIQHYVLARANNRMIALFCLFQDVST